MLATACSTDPADPEATEPTGDGTESAAPAPDTCGTTDLVWAHEQDPENFHLDDPNNNKSITSYIRQSLWDGLYGISAATEYFPELLAEEMEVIDNGDGTFTFNGTLRDGLMWSDGTPLTTAHVVGTYDIIMEGYDYEAKSGGDYLITSRIGYDSIVEGSFVAVSDTEFTYNTTGFFAGYKALLSEIFPTHVVANAAEANAAFPTFAKDGETLPSSGPMLFDTYEQGVTLHLVTNESYHGSVSPDVTRKGEIACVSGVTINFVADTDTQVNALKAGEADIIFAQPQTQFEGAIAQDSDFTVASAAGPVFEHWGLNLKDTHLSDPLVREAMALAMNKAEVMTGLYTPLFGNSLPAEGLGNTYWLSNQSAYVNHAAAAGYGIGDIEGAKAKLVEAGYEDTDGDGIVEHPERGKLSLRVGTTGGNELRETQQQILQQQYAAAGIEITIDNVDGAAYFGERPFADAAMACATGTPEGETVTFGAGTEDEREVTSDCDVWDITQFAWVGGPWPGGQNAAYLSSTDPEATSNAYGFANADFDAKATECDQTVDDAARADCYNELDLYVTTLEKDPEQGLFMLPLTQKPTFFAYSNVRMSQAGVSPDSNSAGPLVNVVDYVPAG